VKDTSGLAATWDAFAVLLALLGQLPELPSPELRTDPAPYVAVFGIGFMLGVAGHLFRSRTMIAAGVLMCFMATVVLPLLAFWGER
jgi:hypothetical protein